MDASTLAVVVVGLVAGLIFCLTCFWALRRRYGPPAHEPTLDAVQYYQVIEGDDPESGYQAVRSFQNRPQDGVVPTRGRQDSRSRRAPPPRPSVHNPESRPITKTSRLGRSASRSRSRGDSRNGRSHERDSRRRSRDRRRSRSRSRSPRDSGSRRSSRHRRKHSDDDSDSQGSVQFASDGSSSSGEVDGGLGGRADSEDDIDRLVASAGHTPADPIYGLCQAALDQLAADTAELAPPRPEFSASTADSQAENARPGRRRSRARPGATAVAGRTRTGTAGPDAAGAGSAAGLSIAERASARGGRRRSGGYSEPKAGRADEELLSAGVIQRVDRAQLKTLGVTDKRFMTMPAPAFRNDAVTPPAGSALRKMAPKFHTMGRSVRFADAVDVVPIARSRALSYDTQKV